MDRKTLFSYSGVISKEVIAQAVEEVEKINDINLSTKLATIIIEQAQNIIHYSKSEDSNDVSSKGEIEINFYPTKKVYEVITRNYITQEDLDRIAPRLEEIMRLDRSEIRKRYKELRKSGENTHNKGGGIGFYEIAKLVDEFSYSFSKTNDKNYLFEIKVKLFSKK